MATTNDVTGDRLISGVPSDEYRSNYDQVFGKRNDPEPEKEVPSPEPLPEIGRVFFGNAYFSWQWKGCGFGQMSISMDKETGEISIDNECMGPESTRKILHALADHIADHVYPLIAK